jgi:hypothetical protein
MMKSVTVAAGLVVFLFPVVALSQEDHYTFTVSALGGVGGSLDEDAGYGNQSFQLGLAVLREDLVHVGLRLNRTEFDADDRLNTIYDATLTYLTLGAEYRYVESFYDSGLYAGIGAYKLEGTEITGHDQSETAIGLALGVTGDFPINNKFAVLVEISGHITDLENSGNFALAHIGIAYHF